MECYETRRLSHAPDCYSNQRRLGNPRHRRRQPQKGQYHDDCTKNQPGADAFHQYDAMHAIGNAYARRQRC
jgi:hypothetical protein